MQLQYSEAFEKCHAALEGVSVERQPDLLRVVEGYQSGESANWVTMEITNPHVAMACEMARRGGDLTGAETRMECEIEATWRVIELLESVMPLDRPVFLVALRKALSNTPGTTHAEETAILNAFRQRPLSMGIAPGFGQEIAS
jgi:hypothetical protein